MNIDSYILAGYALLPKTIAIVDGVSVECVFNQSMHRDDNVLGGFEPDNEAVISIKTSLLTNPKALKGKLVVVTDTTYRVLTVRYGQIVTHLTIISDQAA
jgi:hypothetical protein